MRTTKGNRKIIEEAQYKIDMGQSDSHIVNFVMIECQNDKRANAVLNYIFKNKQKNYENLFSK